MEDDKNKIMREELHGVRVKLDECLQKVLSRIDDYSDEVDQDDVIGMFSAMQVITEIQSARMWCGKMIGALNDELPEGYPTDKAE